MQYNFHPKVVLLRRRGDCPWIDNCYLRSCHLWIRSDKFVDGSFSLHELFSLIDFLGCFFLFVGELFGVVGELFFELANSFESLANCFSELANSFESLANCWFMTHPLVDLQPVLKPHAKLELRVHLNFREIPAYFSRLSASGSATISGTSSGNSYLLIWWSSR